MKNTILAAILLLAGRAAAGTVGDPVNLTTIKGAPVSTGSGAADAGTLRVYAVNGGGGATSSTMNVVGLGGAALASEETLVAVSTNVAALQELYAALSKENTQVAVSTTLSAIQTRASLLATEATQISMSATTTALKDRADLLATEATLLAVKAQTDQFTFSGGRLRVDSNASSTGTVVYPLSAAASQSVQTVGTVTQTVMLPANALRVGVECDDLCDGAGGQANCAWDVPATASSAKVVANCSNWVPPAVSTAALNCLATTSTQTIRCTDYSRANP